MNFNYNRQECSVHGVLLYGTSKTLVFKKNARRQERENFTQVTVIIKIMLMILILSLIISGID